MPGLQHANAMPSLADSQRASQELWGHLSDETKSNVHHTRNGLEHEKKMSCGEAPRAYVTKSIMMELRQMKQPLSGLTG